MAFTKEGCIGVVAFLVVITGVIMAVSCTFIIPLYIVDPDVYYQANEQKFDYLEAVEMCSCLAKVYPTGTKYPIMFKAKTYNRFRNYFRGTRGLNSRRLQHHFLASLSIPAYSDDDKSNRIFACNGVVFGQDQVITSKDCVRDESEWYDLKIRNNSPYWSTYGNTFTVKNYTEFSEHFVLITINGKFSNSSINYYNNSSKFDDFERLTTIGWDDSMYKKTIAHRIKYDRYSINERVTTQCRLYNVDTSKIAINSEILLASTENSAVAMENRRLSYCKEFKTLTQPEKTLFYYYL